MKRNRYPALSGAVAAVATDNSRALLDSVQWPGVGEYLGLSSRELELVQHIFDGKKFTAIARDMGLALGTVKTYSQRIHRKLQVCDQSELILAVVSAHMHLLGAAE